MRTLGSRPAPQRAHERHGKRRELTNVLDLARQLVNPRRIRVGSSQFPLLKLALVNEAEQAAFPSLFGGDHARLRDQPLPLPRCTSGPPAGFFAFVLLVA